MPATTTKEKPILFSGDRPRKILDGLKTQTRRLCKFAIEREPHYQSCRVRWNDKEAWWEFVGKGTCASPGGIEKFVLDPAYRVGDVLWVREAWYPAFGRTPTSGGCVYRADDDGFHMNPGWSPDGKGGGWKPSIHMPRWACRCRIEVTGVKVERVNAISEDDAQAEGVDHGNVAGQDVDIDGNVWNGAYRRAFAASWDSIHGPGAFARGDWVFAYTFRLVPA